MSYWYTLCVMYISNSIRIILTSCFPTSATMASGGQRMASCRSSEWAAEIMNRSYLEIARRTQKLWYNLWIYRIHMYIIYVYMVFNPWIKFKPIKHGSFAINGSLAMASGFQPPWLYYIILYRYIIGEQPTADLHYMLEGFSIAFFFQPVSQAVKCGVSNTIFCMNWHGCPVLLTASFYGSATDLKRGSDVPFDPLLERGRTSKVKTDDWHICSLDQQVIAINWDQILWTGKLQIWTPIFISTIK